MLDTTPTLAEQTETFDPDEWDDIYILGDIHGCIDELQTMLRRLEPTETDLVLFVGDLIRKGPNSKAVVDIVRANPNYQTVRGNNEQKVIDGRKDVDGLGPDERTWFESLPAVIQLGNDIITHGGVDPTQETHRLREVVTVRSLVKGGSYGDTPYWWQKYEAPPRVFFGHTVLEKPLVTPDVVGLDTGCVYGGSLTAFDWRANRVTEQVISQKTYQERPNDVILNPDDVR